MRDDRTPWNAPDLTAWRIMPRFLAAASHATQNIIVIAARHYLVSCLPIQRPLSEGLQRMDDIERDGDITINIGFGNITFCRDEGGSFAHAVVDMTAEKRPHDRIELAFRVAASSHESIIDVVEKSRRHVGQILRAAADRIEAETAETLLYHQDEIEEPESMRAIRLRTES